MLTEDFESEDLEPNLKKYLKAQRNSLSSHDKDYLNSSIVNNKINEVSEIKINEVKNLDFINLIELEQLIEKKLLNCWSGRATSSLKN